MTSCTKMTACKLAKVPVFKNLIFMLLLRKLLEVIMNKYVSLRLFVDKNDKLCFRTYEFDGNLYYINDLNEIELMLNKDEVEEFETTVRKISIDNNWREVGSRVVDVGKLIVSHNTECPLIKKEPHSLLRSGT